MTDDNKPQVDLNVIAPPKINMSASELRRSKKEETVLVSKEHVQSELHSLVIIFLKIGAGILLVLVAVRVLHLVIPPCYRWLPVDDLNAIDKMLFSGAFGGLVLSYLKELISSEKKNSQD